MARTAERIPAYIRDICVIRGQQVWRIAIGCGLAGLVNPWLNRFVVLVAIEPPAPPLVGIWNFAAGALSRH
jgi:hypothetical protein